MKLILTSDLLHTPFDHPELWVSSDLKSVQLPFAALATLLKSEYTLVNGDHGNGGIYHSQDVRVDSDNGVIDWLGDENIPLLSISLFSEHGDVMFEVGQLFKIMPTFDSNDKQMEHHAMMDLRKTAFLDGLQIQAGILSDDQTAHVALAYSNGARAGLQLFGVKLS